MIYRFLDCVLDQSAFTLSVAGTACHVEPRVFDLILYFIQSDGRIVSRDDIIEHVWGGRIVSDATIASCIKSARQALGDDGASQKTIRTVRGRGFKFVADVSKTGAPQPAAAAVSMSDVSTTMEDRAAQEPATPSRPSIAVLPLQLLTPHERYGTLGDGVSHEVILELSRLHWMFVIARGSSFTFRTPDVDLKTVSDVLGVRYVMTGTLSVRDATSVVTVELTQGADGRVVWAERFEQPVADLMLLRSQIVTDIVSAIEARVQAVEAIRACRLSTENLDAWSAYHRGLWHMFRFNDADNAKAAELFTLATKQDPFFARAYAGISFTHFQNAFLNFSGDRATSASLARSHAEKSYELDPFDPFVNLTLGRAEWIAGDPTAAIPWLERSIELNPNYAFALYNRALLAVLQGEGELSASQIERAISLSPVDPLAYAMLATRSMMFMLTHNYEEAVKWAGRAIRAPNAHFQAYAVAAISFERGGQRAMAEQCVARIRSQKPDFKQADFFRAFPITDAAFLDTVKTALCNLGVA
jgi:TolB-like protein/tetratricopeptide (TPR) repeat protein